MKQFRKGFLVSLGFALISAFGFSVWQITDAQTKPLTYPEITTTLNLKLPTAEFKNKIQLINWLIKQVDARGVDRPLTADREDDLRQAGATDALIEAIRESSPLLPKTKTAVATPKEETTSVSPLPTPKPGESLSAKEIKNSIGMEFVKIPAGTFVMGEAPYYRLNVTITKGFYLGKYEVTQEQYKRLVPSYEVYDRKCLRCPAMGVAWYEAQAFVQKLNTLGDGTYRLPTEAEWEYAARSGATTTWSFGDDIKQITKYGNCDLLNDREDFYPTKVGSFLPNAFGLYDMIGNASEWVQDWCCSPLRSGDLVDPVGVATGTSKIVKGGDYINLCEKTKPGKGGGYDPSDRRLGSIGFRVLRVE